MPVRALIIAGLGLAALLCPGETCRAQSAPAAAAATEQELARSWAAIEALDDERLVRDRDYAEQILGHIDRIRADLPDDPQASLAFDTLRLAALVTLGRQQEVRSSAESVLARRPREAGEYLTPISAALALQDNPLLVTVVETASRSVPGVAWSELRPLLDRDLLFPAFQELAIADRDDLRVRLAAALFRIGWPGDGDIDTPDALRLILLEERLRQGDRSGAADLAA